MLAIEDKAELQLTFVVEGYFDTALTLLQKTQLSAEGDPLVIGVLSTMHHIMKGSDQAKRLQELENYAVTLVSSCCFSVKYIGTEWVQMELTGHVACPDTKAIVAAHEDNSDLVPCVYEGGLKVGLVRPFGAGGCGYGLPGLVAYAKQAKHVCFQDFNSGVLELATIPSVLLNSVDRASACRFVAGDWASLTDLLELEKFDMILTSETVYNPENYAKLHNVFKHLLQPKGVIYLAAKSCYFGVGGSVRQFENYMAQQNVFNSEVCWKHKNGVSREILRISFKT